MVELVARVRDDRLLRWSAYATVPFLWFALPSSIRSFCSYRRSSRSYSGRWCATAWSTGTIQSSRKTRTST